MSGFFGRRDRREDRDPRLPPGQYDTGSGFPVLTAEPTPDIDPDEWTFRIDGLVGNGAHLDVRRPARTRPVDTYEGDIHCVTTWSKLDTSFTGVSLDTLIDAGRRRRRRKPRGCVEQHRLHHQPADRGRHRRQGLAGLGPRGRAAAAASTAARSGCWCRTCTSGSRPSGSPGCASSTTTSPASGRSAAITTGATRGWSSGTPVTDPQLRCRCPLPSLPHDRGRSTARRPPPAGARREWQFARVIEIRRENRRMKTFRLKCSPPMLHTPGPARRGPADRARRLPGVAVVQHRLGARTTAARSRSWSSGWRTARSRCTSTTGSTSATRSRSAGRSAAGSSGTAARRRCSSAAARASCR